MLQALGSGAADDWSDGSPLGGHQLGQMQQLLLLLSGPLCLFDAGVQPLIPTDRAGTGDPLRTLHRLSFSVTLTLSMF